MERYADVLTSSLGLRYDDGWVQVQKNFASSDALSCVSNALGVRVMPKAPTRVGARMGRPEKAKERKMRPPPHVLFPVGRDGGPQRLVKEAAAKGAVSVEVGLRRCVECGKRWFLPACTCGGHTARVEGPSIQKIPISEVLERASRRLKIGKIPEMKGVQGMVSKEKTPEPLEKGILRAIHGVYVFKDGTIRFDMTNLPLTHFRPSEIGLTVERARELGYLKDCYGKPLTSEDQLVELRPQDIIPSRDCGIYLVKASKFLDDLLEKFYGLEPYYRAKEPEDLIGHLVIGLAPHTSGGVVGRIIGFTEAKAAYAHPYFHAGKRRNADGDEDAILLLMDGFLNFSRSYLPEKRGGLMDAPLVLTTRLDPNEIDKEAHSIDVGFSYPPEFYEAASRYAHPREVEGLVDTVGKRIGSILQYEGLGFTHDVKNINRGPLKSAYKKGSMIDKMEGQLSLALRIRAVDAADVVSRIVAHHFLPDLIGNLKAFSSQQVRCTKCNAKFRRIPLRTRCSRCGGNLTLTVHENSVKKYLEVSKRISQEYELSPYVRQRVSLVDDAIRSLFTDDAVKELKLDDFL